MDISHIPGIAASGESVSPVKLPAGSGDRPVPPPQSGEPDESKNDPRRIAPGDSLHAQILAKRILGSDGSAQHSRLDIRIADSGEIVVRLVDDKGEVIRQIPPDALNQVAKHIDGIIGVVFDRKA
jgi:hypothetical protein